MRCPSIIPPHILDSIAKNGTKQQREDALQTKSLDATFRQLRAARNKAIKVVPNAFQCQRTIRTGRNIQSLEGPIVRAEGGKPTGDPATDEAYDGLGATFKFFKEVFGRNSIDDEGLPLHAVVKFGRSYSNAFWDGAQMVFGDGDGVIFNRFTASLDVIGHELAHGVTEDESGLFYFYQSGALNESMSDVFGSMVKQHSRKDLAIRANWVIGEGLFTPRVKGVGLRSMKAPGTAYDDPLLGKDPQPAHMRDYINTFEDNGGVHLNSSIPNHAFYQAAVRFRGHSWEKAGKIWYETLRDPRLRPNSGFQRFAQITLDNARRLGFSQTIIRRSWSSVGITV
jgi:Zn-dependent metalloprotease